MPPQIIATETIPVLTPDSQQTELTIRISEPESASEEGHTYFRCTLEIEGAFEAKEIRGVSSLQALALAYSVLNKQLLSLHNQGWSLQTPKGIPVSLEIIRYNLFPYELPRKKF